ncbi:protein preY, mitochondrial [Cynara cardunculus var. scolymus]|uniref:protein preY, mitochondrial n=1 Tax=Cynara cardunculus var. scolymus TaxID=59895 RepID=UPI000D62D435|nr:protein preY, mitochondrial [Cynara cardunculus var. scolymus]
MVRGTRIVEISKSLSEILVCPLSKQPLRVCEKSNSLISHAIGVSFPIVDGIPCLVPQDGKIIEAEDSNSNGDTVDTKSRWRKRTLQSDH